MVDSGLLNRNPDFGSLRLTRKGWAVLDGKEKFLISEQPRALTIAPTPSGPADTELFRKLKALRKRLADESRVPAYVIFSDQSLLEMVLRVPQTEAQFLLIHGVGKIKLANHGQQFLHLIREHCAHTSNTAAVGAPGSIVPIQRLPGSRSAEIAKLFVNGRAIEQIATAFQIKPATVVENLYRFHQAGGKLDRQRILDESKLHVSQQAQVFEEFERLGAERLAPVFEALGRAVPYEELHLLRLWWVTGFPSGAA